MGSVQQPLELLSPVRGIHVYAKRHKKPNVKLADIDTDPSKDFLKSFEDGSIAKDDDDRSAISEKGQELKAETQGDGLGEGGKTEELTKQQHYKAGTPQAENRISATGADASNESNEQLNSSTNRKNEHLTNATESSGDKMTNNAHRNKAEETTGGSIKEELNQFFDKLSKPQLGYERRKRQRHTANLEDKAPEAVTIPEPESPSGKKQTKSRSSKSSKEYSEHEDDGEEDEADEEEYEQQEDQDEKEELEEQEKDNQKETSKEASSKGRMRAIPPASRSRNSGAKRRRRGSKVTATPKNKAGKNSNNNRTPESSEDDGNLSNQEAIVAEKARSMGLTEGVYKWLRELSLIKYAEYFERHEVEDEVLPLLTFDDLREMGISAVGARRKMFTSIQEMDSKRKQTNP